MPFQIEFYENDVLRAKEDITDWPQSDIDGLIQVAGIDMGRSWMVVNYTDNQVRCGRCGVVITPGIYPESYEICDYCLEKVFEEK